MGSETAGKRVNSVKTSKSRVLSRNDQIRYLKSAGIGNLIEYNCKCPDCSGVLFLTGKSTDCETFRCYGCKSIIRKDSNNKLTLVESKMSGSLSYSR